MNELPRQISDENMSRVDVTAKSKVSVDNQAKMLQLHRLEVQDIYKRYCHHELTSDAMFRELQLYQIRPTKSLSTMMSKSGDEISFVEFIKALNTIDPNEDRMNDYELVAGQSNEHKAAKFDEDDDYNLFGTRRRKLM
jgi:hypothetical protein